MREIKFRGKRVDNGEWVYGDIAHHDNVISHVGQHPADGSMVVFDLDPTTVGQYTGLLDKDGREIYEGDILEFNHRGDVRSYVIFDDGSFDVKNQAKDVLLYLNIINHKVNVISNIHDNPELLEVSHD